MLSYQSSSSSSWSCCASSQAQVGLSGWATSGPPPPPTPPGDVQRRQPTSIMPAALPPGLGRPRRLNAGRHNLRQGRHAQIGCLGQVNPTGSELQPATSFGPRDELAKARHFRRGCARSLQKEFQQPHVVNSRGSPACTTWTRQSELRNKLSAS